MATKCNNYSPMARKPSIRRPALDPFDRAILRILQRDNRTPQRTIAEAVNLSAAAVQRRIAAMESAGIIARNVAVVDAAALGMAITSIVEVHLTDERAGTVDAAKALFRAAPEVQQCYYVTGGISFVVVIVATDMVAYEAITRRLFAQNEAVASYRSLVALDRVKFGAEVQVPSA
ncbi:Lrp/AsnC family transcriptional regulator [Novosphingobium rosa]|uniref:Lrp/AsnC family transcriptional regulator n=1 Tax=Novosphingobium rosa TaxID=76978 RepID=UPI001FDF0A6A